jgi:hypothetical protein
MGNIGKMEGAEKYAKDKQEGISCILHTYTTNENYITLISGNGIK